MPKQFVPRQRKQKARLRARQSQQNHDHDSNAVEIIPESKSAKENRRAQMKAELAQEMQGAISSKKRKRMDKYIDTKLRKQDNLELIKKLATQKIDTSLLRSSKKLGRSTDSARERLTAALHERRHGLANNNSHHLLFQERHEYESDSDAPEVRYPAGNSAHSTSRATEPTPASSVRGGSGLKRPLDLDEDGNPIIQRRKRHKQTVKRRIPFEPVESETSFGSEDSAVSEETWEGFSSADGASHDEEIEDQSSGGSDADDTDASSMLTDSFTENTGEVDLQQRSSTFKAWAQSQRNAAVGFEPSQNVLSGVSTNHSTRIFLSTHDEARSNPVSSPDQVSFLNGRSESMSIARQVRREVYHVPISRPVDIEVSRQELPVVAKEQEIMETVFSNDIVILSGATGSGKTTQVPQFLLEAGYGDPKSSTSGMIGITQPRRVAAISMAKRVAYEVGDLRDTVSHQVRFDSSTSPRTRLKFMTDGILLREVSNDFTLSKYSAIIIDEAHERTVNTEILVGMLSRIVETRKRLSTEKRAGFKPLRVIIMSATLQVSDFKENRDLFRHHPPPLIDVEGKQYSVTTHFARNTKRDYVQEMFNKVRRGHRKLPPGGMLVFLTGQNEIEYLERRLKTEFPCTEKSSSAEPKMHVSAQHTTVEVDDINVENNHVDSEYDFVNEISGLSDAESDAPDEDYFDVDGEGATPTKRVHVLPLYSQLPADQQARVFEMPPADSRLIILATNVAETSITIPNIRYVFDTGRSKAKHFDVKTGVQTFSIDWISKASAQQRAGRAGRTGPGGHCYRIYSSAIYEDTFPAFADPEITQTPIEGVVLQLKAMGIPDITRFPFPTPLEPQQLLEAERLLRFLKCLDNVTNTVTDLGKQISSYPISPRLARILTIAERQPSLLQHALSLVAILGLPEVFVSDAQLGLTQNLETALDTRNDSIWTQQDADRAARREKLKQERDAFHRNMARPDKYSDATKMIVALAEYASSTASPKTNDPLALQALRKFTRMKSLKEAAQLRMQLTSLVALHGSVNLAADSTRLHLTSSPPSSAQALLLRQMIAAGYIDNLAQRADLSPSPPASTRNPSNSIQVPYLTLFPSKNQALSKSTVDELDAKARERLQYVYIHPASTLAHVPPQKLPQYVVYSHLSTSSPSTIALQGGINIPRTRMHPLSPVPADTIKDLIQATPLAGEGKPIGKIESLPRNSNGQERRAIYSVPYIRSGSEIEGGREWPLPPARRVVQVRRPLQGWVEE